MAEHLERPGKAAFRPHAEVLHPGKSSIELLWAQNSPAYPSRMPGFIWKRCATRTRRARCKCGGFGATLWEGDSSPSRGLARICPWSAIDEDSACKPIMPQSFEGQHDSQHQSNIARAPLFLQLRDPTAPEHHPLGAGLSRCVTFALLG